MELKRYIKDDKKYVVTLSSLLWARTRWIVNIFKYTNDAHGYIMPILYKSKMTGEYKWVDGGIRNDWKVIQWIKIAFWYSIRRVYGIINVLKI